MAVQLNNKQKKLLEGKNFATVATIRKDGSAQLSPVWIDFDGKHIIMNTEQKRAKPKNIKRDPRVALSIYNQENPYEYMSVQGRAVEVTPEGAADHIDKMSKKYIGQDKYPYNRPGDVRLIVKIEPESVYHYGGGA